MVFETSFLDNVKSPKAELDKCPCRWRNEHHDHVERGDDWNEEVETIEHASDRVAGKKCEERLRKRCRNAQQMSKFEATARMHAPTITSFQLNMSCDTRTIVENHWGARKEKLQERTDCSEGATGGKQDEQCVYLRFIHVWLKIVSPVGERRFVFFKTN